MHYWRVVLENKLTCRAEGCIIVVLGREGGKGEGPKEAGADELLGEGAIAEGEGVGAAGVGADFAGDGMDVVGDVDVPREGVDLAGEGAGCIIVVLGREGGKGTGPKEAGAEVLLVEGVDVAGEGVVIAGEGGDTEKAGVGGSCGFLGTMRVVGREGGGGVGVAVARAGRGGAESPGAGFWKMVGTAILFGLVVEIAVC